MLTLGYGNAAETATVASTAGAAAPYTITVSALTQAHGVGTPVTGETSRYSEIYLETSTGLLWLPSNVVVQNRVDLGTTRDTSLKPAAAGVIQATTPAAGIGVFRTGSGTTVQRPSATTVGAGAMYFDTTVGTPIWSTGTAWVDATGTLV